jgi:hypothetical protein
MIHIPGGRRRIKVCRYGRFGSCMLISESGGGGSYGSSGGSWRAGSLSSAKGPIRG